MWSKIKNFYIKPKQDRDIDVEFRRIWINNWSTMEVLTLTMEAQAGRRNRGAW